MEEGEGVSSRSRPHREEKRSSGRTRSWFQLTGRRPWRTSGSSPGALRPSSSCRAMRRTRGEGRCGRECRVAQCVSIGAKSSQCPSAARLERAWAREQGERSTRLRGLGERAGAVGPPQPRSPRSRTGCAEHYRSSPRAHAPSEAGQERTSRDSVAHHRSSLARTLFRSSPRSKQVTNIPFSQRMTLHYQADALPGAKLPTGHSSNRRPGSSSSNAPSPSSLELPAHSTPSAWSTSEPCLDGEPRARAESPAARAP